MNISRIDRATCQIIREKLDEVLANHGMENVEVKLRNGSFTDGNVTFKLEVAIEGDNGVFRSKEVEDWKQFCFRFNLPDDAIGKTVTIAGEQVKIVGLKPRSPRFPVIGQRESDSKRFKYTAAAIKFAIDKQDNLM